MTTFRWTAIELGSLGSIAVSQPLLDVFGQSPEVFVEAGASTRDIVLFAALVAIGPLCAAVVLTGVARLLGGPRGLSVVGALSALTLFGVAGIHLARQLTDTGVTVVVLASIAAALGFLGWRYTFWLHTWLRFLAPAPLLFAAMFVVASPTGELAIGNDAAPPVELAPEERGPVVVLVLDEFPVSSLFDERGEIDADRYPGFARLAAESTWFRNTTAVGSHTEYALPAILTGRYPTTEDVAPLAEDHPDNIFRLLGAGYRFNVSEEITRLCALDRCNPGHPDNRPATGQPVEDRDKDRDDALSLPNSESPLRSLISDAAAVFRSQLTGSGEQAIEDRLIGSETVRVDADSESTTAPLTAPTPTTRSENRRDLPDYTVQPARFATWLAKIDGDTETPQFSFLHALIPHRPWRLDADGRQYPTIENETVGMGRLAWLDRPGAITTQRQRHFEMVRYADSLISALLDRLVALDVLDAATVVVVADHGIGLDPATPLRRYTPEAGTDIAGVPLFVRSPDSANGTIDDRPAQTIDVVPTIAATIDVDLPWAVEGIDLRGPTRERTRHPFEIRTDPTETRRREFQLLDIDVSNHLTALLRPRPELAALGADDFASWRIGPQPELLGATLETIPLGAALDATITFDPESLGTRSTVDDDGSTRAMVVARLDGVSTGATVAVAVDGVIVSTATVDRVDNASVLFAFVPPGRLTRSDLEVRYFVVDTDGPLRLRALMAT